MAIGVDYSAWLVQDGEIKRRFVYQDSKTKQYVATIYLDCKVERGVNDTHTFLSLTASTLASPLHRSTEGAPPPWE
jgi:hypothetical protein